MIIIRTMMRDPNSKSPLIFRGKAATLGVRKRDIQPDDQGNVHPDIHEGMSAFILPENNIHPDFLPEKFGGTSTDVLYEIHTDVLIAFDLKFELDRPEDPKCVHGVIKTTQTMPLCQYEENLEKTQGLWKER